MEKQSFLYEIFLFKFLIAALVSIYAQGIQNTQHSKLFFRYRGLRLTFMIKEYIKIILFPQPFNSEY